MNNLIGTVAASSSTILKRSLLSAFYLAALTFLLMVGLDREAALKGLAVLPVLVLLGVVVAHVAYECVLPAYQNFSCSRVMMGFCDIVSEKDRVNIQNYNDLRRWRAVYLDGSDSKHYREALLKDMEMRQVLTYLAASSIASVFLLIASLFWHGENPSIIKGEIVFSVFLLLLSSVGHRNRSIALGRSHGQAYINAMNNMN